MFAAAVAAMAAVIVHHQPDWHIYLSILWWYGWWLVTSFNLTPYDHHISISPSFLFFVFFFVRYHHKFLMQKMMFWCLPLSSIAKWKSIFLNCHTHAHRDFHSILFLIWFSLKVFLKLICCCCCCCCCNQSQKSKWACYLI